MTNLNLNLPSGVEEEQEVDSLGGRFLLPSKVYLGTVKQVYIHASKSGALYANISFQPDQHADQVIQQKIFFSNKKGEFTYEKDGKQHTLPGYSQMNSFFTLITGEGFTAQKQESGQVGIWDPAEKKEIPTDVTVFPGVEGKKIGIGILQVKEEITTAASQYKDGTGKYREFNEFDKFFNAETGCTLKETREGKEVNQFMQDWGGKFDGELIVREAQNPGAAANTSSGGNATAGGGGGGTSPFGT